MKSLIRSKRVLLLVAFLLLATAGGSMTGTAMAASGPPVSASPGQAPRAPVPLGHPTVSIDATDDGRLLYVDDGACADAIDVYTIHASGLVFVGAFPTGGGCAPSRFFGSQDLDVTPANDIHGRCLVYADLGNGFVDSFPIVAGGGLGVLVSQLPNSGADDVHIAHNGRLVYVNSPGSQLASYALGPGCTLTALATLPVTNFYISVALINATRLVTVDSNTGTIDTFALTSSGGISLLNSVPGQIASPDSVAVLTRTAKDHDPSDVFTGQATGSPPQAQGAREKLSTGALTFLGGSPASDPAGSNGAAVFADDDHLLLVQGEQLSNSLAVYKIGLGHPGSMAFLEETPLSPTGGLLPSAFARVDNTLFVETLFGGDVEACLITSSSGVSGCATAAVLPDTTGSMGGIVLLRRDR